MAGIQVEDHGKSRQYRYKTIRPQVNVQMVMITEVPRLRPNPTRAISGSRTRPEPYTTAFGGVATGSMNAQEAARVAGNISINGSTLAAMARS